MRGHVRELRMPFFVILLGLKFIYSRRVELNENEKIVRETKFIDNKRGSI